MPFMTPERLRRYSVGLLVGVAIGFAASVFSGQGGSTLTGRLGGDFPAFYGAARIVADGDAVDLYERARQQAAQRDLIPAQSGFLLFAYPPYVAVAYAPLALLPYRLAYVLHTAFMLGAVILSLHLLRRISRPIDRQFLPVVALALAFYPLLMATFNGQNTPITLLLIVLTWRAALGGRLWLAGVWLGLLLYKPQFALPLVGLYLLSGRWKVAVASAAVGAVLFGVSAVATGGDWFSEWLAFARWFANVDAEINRHNAISWLGFLQALLGTESRAALVAGGMLIGTMVVGVSWLWAVAGRRGDETARMAVTVPCLVLMSPHAMYYEIGVCLFTYAAMLDSPLPRKSVFVAIVLLLGASQLLAGNLGASPVFLLAVGTSAVAGATFWTPATGPRRHHGYT